MVRPIHNRIYIHGYESEPVWNYYNMPAANEMTTLDMSMVA